MPKRFTDTDIWKKQRWFRKLKPIYKLVFFYIKDQCNHAGIWDIDCSDLVEDLGLDDFDLSDFVGSINIEFDKITGKKTNKERVIILDNKLWITGFMQFQYENKEKKMSISAPVKTGLLLLSAANVLENAIFKGYITLTDDLSEKYIALTDNSVTLTEKIVTLTEDLNRGYTRAKDKDNTVLNKVEKTKKNFSMIEIYKKTWAEYSLILNGQAKNLTEEIFNEWKNFVDFIDSNDLNELFECKFITPIDFGKIQKEHSFLKNKWLPVLKKILATGIKPEHNLYFRIPEFLSYSNKPVPETDVSKIKIKL